MIGLELPINGQPASPWGGVTAAHQVEKDLRESRLEFERLKEK
jgi:hypothetical protein